MNQIPKHEGFYIVIDRKKKAIILAAFLFIAFVCAQNILKANSVSEPTYANTNIDQQ